MKFAKNLQRTMNLYSPRWDAYWVNYKALKKIIKAMPKVDSARVDNGTNKEDVDKKIAESPEEVAFFKALREELRRLSRFYVQEENRSIAEAEKFMLQYKSAKKDGKVAPEERTQLMLDCVSFYKKLLLLENYAVMNYCGLSKILKKHDKCTGYQTRVKYMSRMVNHQPFTAYPRLLKMLEETERVFNELSAVSQPSGEEGPLEGRSDSKLGRERFDLSLEAIQSMNSESKRLQDQEIDVTQVGSPMDSVAGRVNRADSRAGSEDAKDLLQNGLGKRLREPSASEDEKEVGKANEIANSKSQRKEKSDSRTNGPQTGS